MSKKILFSFNPKSKCFHKVVDRELIERLLNGNWCSKYSDLT
jgi:hypothetical protein